MLLHPDLVESIIPSLHTDKGCVHVGEPKDGQTECDAVLSVWAPRRERPRSEETCMPPAAAVLGGRAERQTLHERPKGQWVPPV